MVISSQSLIRKHIVSTLGTCSLTATQLLKFVSYFLDNPCVFGFSVRFDRNQMTLILRDKCNWGVESVDYVTCNIILYYSGGSQDDINSRS